MVHQLRAEIRVKPAEVFGEVHDVLEVEDDTSEERAKVGKIVLDKGPQTPTKPIPSVPTDKILTREGTRKKRIKTLAGRTDLSWVRKLLAQQSSSPSSRQPSAQCKQPTQPTRKSYRFAA